MLPTFLSLGIDCVARPHWLPLNRFKLECEHVRGCHDLGVFDKVVLNLVTLPSRN